MIQFGAIFLQRGRHFWHATNSVNFSNCRTRN